MRLKQGRMQDSTVFSDDPVSMAAHWRDLGCKRLHIVDLDGAFAGKPKNQNLIERMVQTMGSVPVQVGGGVRSLSTIDAYLQAGISDVIVGTKAIQEPEFLQQACEQAPHKIIFGLDARNGRVATHGWDETSEILAMDLAKQAAQLDLTGIVYTDIDRDGMMTGVNVPATLELAQHAHVPVVASGGISTLADIQALKEAFADAPQLLLGAITGRAIYEGSLDVVAGQACFDGQ